MRQKKNKQLIKSSRLQEEIVVNYFLTCFVFELLTFKNVQTDKMFCILCTMVAGQNKTELLVEVSKTDFFLLHCKGLVW